MYFRTNYAKIPTVTGNGLSALAELHGIGLNVMENYYISLPPGSILPKKYKALEDGVRRKILNRLELMYNSYPFQDYLDYINNREES